MNIKIGVKTLLISWICLPISMMVYNMVPLMGTSSKISIHEIAAVFYFNGLFVLFLIVCYRDKCTCKKNIPGDSKEE